MTRRGNEFALLVVSVIFGACGGLQPLETRRCVSLDDSECFYAKLEQPSDPNLRVGRPVRPDSTLKQEVAALRRQYPSLKKQIVLEIDKSERTLTVRIGEHELRSYGVSLGFDPVGGKLREGDGKTPEGEFYVGYTAPPRSTKYHRSLLISYPDKKAAEKGLETGRITERDYGRILRALRGCKPPPQNTPLGGYVLIHGGGGGPGYGNWTLGCVALTNEDIEEVHSVVGSGCSGRQPRTRIVIRP